MDEWDGVYGDRSLNGVNLPLIDDNNIVYWDNTNLDSDPIFMYPTLPSEAPTDAGNYHLSYNSPCLSTGLDTGDPDLFIDLDGGARPYPLGSAPDMGAFEDYGFSDIWAADRYTFSYATTFIDTGYEPNPDTGPMWLSEAIRVSQVPPSASIMAGHDLVNHVNPISGGGSDNWIYVELANRGNEIHTDDFEVKVYAAKASTGLAWDTDWMNNYGPAPDYLFYGDYIDSVWVTQDLAPGEKITIAVEWPNVPNPEQYGGLQPDHFCLLARIVEPTPMSTLETASVNFNTKSNNNIVWKNVNIITPDKGNNFGQIIARGIEKKETTAKMQFVFDDIDVGNELLREGEILVKLEPEMYNSWIKSGAKGKNVSIVGKYTLKLASADAYIEGFGLKYRQWYWVQINFDYTPNFKAVDKANSQSCDRMFHVIQYSGRRYSNRDGGVSYCLTDGKTLPSLSEKLESFRK